MTNEKIVSALNAQINAELYSAYLYLAMAAYFESSNLPGFASWMTMQAREEQVHAMKIYNFINERLWRVKLEAIAAPEFSWESPLAVFTAAFAHEQKVTAMIYNLVDLASNAKDYATQNFLQWFVAEQVEEEAHADAIVHKIKSIANEPVGLLLLDKELGKRAAA